MTPAAATLLAEVRARGAWLAAGADGTLNIRAPRGLLTEDLRRRLAEQKADLLRLLRREAAAIPHAPGADATNLDAVLEAFDGSGFRCTGMLWRVPLPPKAPPEPQKPASLAGAIEEARQVYLTRLGIASDQHTPTEPGSSAELIAWEEAMAALILVATRPEASSPGQSSLNPADHAEAATREPAINRTTE